MLLINVIIIDVYFTVVLVLHDNDSIDTQYVVVYHWVVLSFADMLMDQFAGNDCY
jgi:hypothetical protein